MICQKRILLKLFTYNEEAFEAIRSVEEDNQNSSTTGWNEAAIILLEQTSTLISSFINLMLVEDGFRDLWTELCHKLRLLLDRSNLALSAAVFTAVEKILSEIEEKRRVAFRASTEATWTIWMNGNPSTHKMPGRKATDNQAALLAYLHCLTALYPLLLEELKLDHVQIILEQLQRCATDSSPTAYSDDSDQLTRLQTQIIQSLRSLDDTVPRAVSELIKCSSFFVTLAFERNASLAGRGGPTFVALSKASMDLLGSLTVKHSNASDIYSDGSFLGALKALLKPISLKYHWRPEGKPPSTWQKATNTAVQILKVAIRTQSNFLLKSPDVAVLWEEILAISNGILLADPASAKKSPSESVADQAFDISAFSNVFDLLVSALGSSQISDQLRRAFSKSLFQNSIIHTPHKDDLPEPESDEILSNLDSKHMGRVCDLYPSRRSRVGYVCLDKLFDLVAQHDSSSEHVRLAQAAAPFLILRVGIVLKTYILDQPLRGRMPTPASQKKELLYVLRKLTELNSEPKAIPDAPGIKSKGKKHLYRVYGFINKAVLVARRDPEVLHALNAVIDIVAGDFGFE